MSKLKEELQACHNNIMTVMENRIMVRIGCNRTMANSIANEILNLDAEAERLLSKQE